MAWRDKHKAPTLLLSSVYSTATTVVTSRNPTTAAVNKPVLVHSYNQSMNGVDLADQFSAYYNFVRRTLKWWRKLMFWLLEVSIVNSYLLYKQAHRGRCLPHIDFRRKLVEGLLRDLPLGPLRHQATHSAPSDQRFLGRHYLDKGQSRRRCVVCSNRGGQRHDTVFFCKTCTDAPPLHPAVCFERYHELSNYQLRT